jgi:DNA mismatch repair ATPase MutS
MQRVGELIRCCHQWSDDMLCNHRQVMPYAAYAGALCLDGPTLTNLELLESSAGSTEGSLLSCLDGCVSAGVHLPCHLQPLHMPCECEYHSH